MTDWLKKISLKVLPPQLADKIFESYKANKNQQSSAEQRPTFNQDLQSPNDMENVTRASSSSKGNSSRSSNDTTGTQDIYSVT